MRPEAAANPVSLQRFFTEAKASGRLRHPNITEIFDLGQAEDGSPFLVLELLTGEPLDSVLRRVPTLAPVQTLLLGKNIAAGLNVAHAKGIVHRDLKPANIFLHRDPITLDVIPKVLDFGISKVTGPEAIDHHATHTGTVVGSPTYMSPEQARGVSDIDARADLWSVAVLMYKCLTGRAPFNAANYNALMVAIMTEPHPPISKWVPTVPKVVSDIIDDCLKKERAERVQSAKALIQRIDSALLSLNAERAKLELPSDDIDDDMPTIARGDRAELVQLVTATATAIASPSQQQQQSPSSLTPAPQSDPSATNAPSVVSSPQLSAVTPQHLSGTQPAAKAELDPIQAAKRKTRNTMIVAAAGFLAVVLTVVVVAVRLSNSSAADKEPGSEGASEEKRSSKKKKDKDNDKDEKDKAATIGTIEDLTDPPTKPSAKPSSSATTTAPTTTATAPPPATTTAPTAATTAPPIYTAKPTATATATVTAVPTATATAKPTATATVKKPPTSVAGPGF